MKPRQVWVYCICGKIVTRGLLFLSQNTAVIKKIALLTVLVFGVLSAYHFISRQVYLGAAQAAFPQLPIDANCYHLSWPFGPEVIGFLSPDDPAYLNRDSALGNSQGLHLIIHDSDGSFVIRPE